MPLTGNHVEGDPNHVPDHNLIDAALAATPGLYMTVVTHGAVAGTARPVGAARVHWLGSVAPSNATSGDHWTDTTTDLVKRWTGSAWAPLSTKGILVTAKNITGTTTPSGATAGVFVNVAGTGITVPVSTADVWLGFQGTISQNVTGTGFAYLCLTETTSGSDVLVTSANEPLPGLNESASIPLSEFHLGPVASARTFKLQILMTIKTGSPQFWLANSVSTPTFLRAEAK